MLEHILSRIFTLNFRHSLAKWLWNQSIIELYFTYVETTKLCMHYKIKSYVLAIKFLWRPVNWWTGKTDKKNKITCKSKNEPTAHTGRLTGLILNDSRDVYIHENLMESTIINFVMFLHRKMIDVQKWEQSIEYWYIHDKLIIPNNLSFSQNFLSCIAFLPTVVLMFTCIMFSALYYNYIYFNWDMPWRFWSNNVLKKQAISINSTGPQYWKILGNEQKKQAIRCYMTICYQ